MDERMVAVVELLSSERFGVLGTLARKQDGWPFGSLVPYALDSKNQPIILVSQLAEHTRNIMSDPRVSLYVGQSNVGQTDIDPQASPRVTLLANARPVAETETQKAKKLYLERFPEAIRNFQMGDFFLLRLEPVHVRYIGGFGQMFWIHDLQSSDHK